MTDVPPQDDTTHRSISRELVVLTLVAILLPYTFEISSSNAIDNSHVQFSVYATLWAACIVSGSTIAGPYTSGNIMFLTRRILVMCIFFLPLYLLLIWTRSRNARGIMSRKSVLQTIGSVLVIQMIILLAVFWIQLDGWYFARSFPLPILHTILWHYCSVDSNVQNDVLTLDS